MCTAVVDTEHSMTALLSFFLKHKEHSSTLAHRTSRTSRDRTSREGSHRLVKAPFKKPLHGFCTSFPAKDKQVPSQYCEQSPHEHGRCSSSFASSQNSSTIVYRAYIEERHTPCSSHALEAIESRTYIIRHAYAGSMYCDISGLSQNEKFYASDSF
jgi:hypothetical protein